MPIFRTPTVALPRAEFVIVMALMTSFVALSIDAMLPALGVIGNDISISDTNDRQLIITLLFLGMAFGQLFWGPLSDSFGRKPVVLVGASVFVCGCLVSALSQDLETMLAGRFLQGLGAAASRIITIAIIRDRYEGNAMAQIMSLIMSVFILVPMVAPAIGQGILWIAGWREIFVVLMVLALIVQAWFAFRQPETLEVENRIPFSTKNLWSAFVEVSTNRQAMGYSVCASLVFGAFVGYLSSSQQILQEQYQLGDAFALYFALIAASIGIASYANSSLVMRFGMEKLSLIAVVSLCVLSVLFLSIAWSLEAGPPFWATLCFLIAGFFPIGILFGNFNALAMQSLGHVAGMATTVIGSVTTFASLSLGTLVGQAYNGTVLPLVAGFAILSTLSMLAFLYVRTGTR